MAGPLRNATAIVGVGLTAYGRFPERSVLSMAGEAIRGAVADAGLAKEQVDGLFVNIGYPLGADYDMVCERLGLRVRYAMQSWSHGRFVGACLQAAAMAVAAGLADYVAVVCSVKYSQLVQLGGKERPDAFRVGGGPHGEAPHYGLTAPGSGAAMSASTYLARYGATEEQLGDVPIAMRRHAERNPRAMLREPLGLDDYLASRYIIEPLRRPDFSLVSDGACCLIVTSAERAADAPSPAVHLAGMQGIRSGPDEFVWARPGLGAQQQPEETFVPSAWDLAVYDYADIARDDIDAFYTYDAFSPLVWYALERFGFCGEGEAPAFCADGGIAPGGRLPVNTNGGLLAEAYLMGWNHLAEMVFQLRGTAGERQLADSRLLQWGSCYGDSLILAKER
ncbi:thiolase family protein [Micromonospora sp. NPDC005161]